ncbi:MAG: acyltransferase [Flavobacterium sp.]|nr:acyltransferase [Flavobacterium sp.]
MVFELIKRISFILYRRKNIFLSNSVKKYSNVLLDTSGGGSIEIGNKTELLYGVVLMTYGGKIKIGKNCSINPYTILYGHGGLTIGNNVLIAGHTMIIPANHNFSKLEIPINAQGESRKGITIKDNVWIGSGCKILDGVTIESGAIIAAGAVVTKNVATNTIVGGIPAQILKNRI